MQSDHLLRRDFLANSSAALAGLAVLRSSLVQAFPARPGEEVVPWADQPPSIPNAAAPLALSRTCPILRLVVKADAANRDTVEPLAKAQRLRGWQRSRAPSVTTSSPCARLHARVHERGAHRGGVGERHLARLDPEIAGERRPRRLLEGRPRPRRGRARCSRRASPDAARWPPGRAAGGSASSDGGQVDSQRAAQPPSGTRQVAQPNAAALDGPAPRHRRRSRVRRDSRRRRQGPKRPRSHRRQAAASA